MGAVAARYIEPIHDVPTGLRTTSVSVVIATRDRPGLLRAVSEQVLAQLAPGDELVIVDDSSDAGDSYDWLPPSARVLRSGGRGPAVARNLGWRAAAGAIVAFTDDDVSLDPGWLAAVRAAFSAEAGLVAVEGRTSSREWHPLFEYSVASTAARNGLTCNAAYRRAALVELGGFDESFPFAHCEDVDLFTRAGRRGVARYCTEMQVEHRPRAIEPRSFARRAGWVASERRLYTKHPELRTFSLPPGLCAFVDYARWPVSMARRHRAAALRDPHVLARLCLLMVLWSVNLVRAIPTMLTPIDVLSEPECPPRASLTDSPIT